MKVESFSYKAEHRGKAHGTHCCQETRQRPREQGDTPFKSRGGSGQENVHGKMQLHLHMTCSKEDAYNRVQFKLLIDLLIQYGVSLTLTRWVAGAKSEVLRSLRHYLRAQSQGHHTIDRLEERGVERESARRSSLKEREKAIINQTNIETVSKATLGKLLRDGVERIWA